MNTHEAQERKLNEDYQKVKMINRERRRKFLENSRKKVNKVEEKAPEGVEVKATLISINQYQKLVFKTTDESTIDTIADIADRFQHVEFKNKRPFWTNETEPELFFKITVPKFMTKDLFKYSKLVNKTVVFHMEPCAYSSDKFGDGYYFRLSSDITPA